MLLNEIILLSKDNNIEDLELVIERFRKLIDSLARKIRTEYAETDLIIFLIQLINKMDEEQIKMMDEASLVMYIVNSLKYKSYKISREKNISTCILEDIYARKDSKYGDAEFLMYLSNLVNGGIITKKQKDILLKKYCNDYTDEKIASKLGISRQAVNKMHNTALNNLRKYLN